MSDFLQFATVLVAAFAVVYYTGHGPCLLRKTTEIVYGKPGCAPVPKIGNVTIHYFAIRGRAEPIRLMLEEAKIVYNETGFTEETWAAAKAKGIEDGIYTFGQVPAMTTTSGIQMVQSQAIVHYIGRSTGMECDCEDLHFCEAVALAVEDVEQKLGKALYDPAFTVKSRNDFLKDVSPLWFGYFEKIAPCLEAQEKAFFASDRLTWVDFLVFYMLDAHVDFSQVKMTGATPVNVLEDYPKLNAFYTQFKVRPRIAIYLESARRHAFTLPYPPQKAGGTTQQKPKQAAPQVPKKTEAPQVPKKTESLPPKKQVLPTQAQPTKKIPESAQAKQQPKVKQPQEKLVPKPTSEQKKATPQTGKQTP